MMSSEVHFEDRGNGTSPADRSRTRWPARERQRCVRAPTLLSCLFCLLSMPLRPVVVTARSFSGCLAEHNRMSPRPHLTIKRRAAARLMLPTVSISGCPVQVQGHARQREPMPFVLLPSVLTEHRNYQLPGDMDSVLSGMRWLSSWSFME
ncbi:hypothetical protein DAEQUDRAFT_23789 [Daedalea quercina L-15889]|uniref:Uncharacterized protein n=1 Tax=Daedalea quercina L-15889 TaxID=1314783 RepID=A0A165UN21_9APHY|nr:hypothetical protein DAEQUDRAFT_23789 [Daedalea quercina L-15889]